MLAKMHSNKFKDDSNSFLTVSLSFEISLIQDKSFPDEKRYFFFNCDSNWYPVCPTFFSCSKLARRWEFFLPVTVVVPLHLYCHTSGGCSVEIESTLKPFFWPIYNSNCGKNYLFGNYIKNKKSVLLVEKKFFGCYFFRSFFQLTLLFWLN